MKFEKFIKNLPDAESETLDKATEGELKSAIAQANQNITTATDERDDNTDYNAAKSVVSDFNSGLKRVKDYQGAKVSYALLRLKEEAGTLDDSDQNDLDEHRRHVDARRPSKKDQGDSDAVTKLGPPKPEDYLPIAAGMGAVVADAAQANAAPDGMTISLNGKDLAKNS